MDDADEATPVTNADTEINQLLGLFDVPAFARRGQDLEYALERIHERCRRERSAMLDMVRIRLRQWSEAAPDSPDGRVVFAAPLDAIWADCGMAPVPHSGRAASPRRRRAIANDLIASVERFNQRWTAFLDDLNLDHINGMIDHYNRYYLLEKECCLGSARLAARHFTPKVPLAREAFRAQYPPLPVPALAAR